jgi:preprotein translocase subunit YajC
MFLNVLLQADGMGLMTNLLPMLLIMVVMYFFFLRPQMEKQKAQDKFVKDLKEGAQVVTTSGIIGRISKIEGTIVTLISDKDTRIKVTLGSISKELTESVSA